MEIDSRFGRKFVAHPGVVVQRTDSAWASENLIANHIKWLYRDVTQDNSAIVILDVYPPDRSRLSDTDSKRR
jgi:hypothetical protein